MGRGRLRVPDRIIAPLGDGYPAGMRGHWERALGAGLGVNEEGDEAAIGGRGDFLGVDSYTRRVMAAAPPGPSPWRVSGPAGRAGHPGDHVEAVRQALEAGADVRGYLHWSLMDNFEWALGHRPRFGLVHVDHATGRRVIKDSGRFHARLIAGGGTPPGPPRIEAFG
ncbi:family 1 glycosylhydrolase [Actinomadura luzonensis]|uniref:family 1 glycosylhydrolase n=1 Tax=Actinomadura luzonensis TaxID=2805427 RepID=UPI0027E29398|nr:family 1 glycosylhydrolase [Actinomadura luzonensis]